jgi:hypothetical protein
MYVIDIQYYFFVSARQKSEMPITGTVMAPPIAEILLGPTQHGRD